MNPADSLTVTSITEDDNVLQSLYPEIVPAGKSNEITPLTVSVGNLHMITP